MNSFRIKKLIVAVFIGIFSLVTLFACKPTQEKRSILQGLPAKDRAQPIGGSDAFPFRLKNLAGVEKTLSDYKGKVVLLNFWATWCVPCIAEMPSLQLLSSLYKDRGLEVVAISGDADAALLKQFVEKQELTFEILQDPTLVVSPRYSVEGFPESFFIDRNGKFIEILDPATKASMVRIVSDRQWDHPSYVSLVEKLLEQTKQ